MKTRKLNNIVANYAGIHYLVVDAGHTFINELDEVYGKHMIFQEMSDKDSYDEYNEKLFIKINGKTFSACPITLRHAITNGIIVTNGDTNTYIFDSGKTLFPDQVDTILKNNLLRGIYYNSENWVNRNLVVESWSSNTYYGNMDIHNNDMVESSNNNQINQLVHISKLSI